MKKTLLIVFVAMIVLAFAATSSFAFGLPKGLPGKSSLKKEIKPLVLKDIDASLAEYEGTDLDPAKDTKFAYTVYGDKDYDVMAVALSKIELTTQFANNVIKDANVKIDAAETADDLKDVQKNVELATKALEALVKDGAAAAAGAVAFGSGLVDKIKKDPLGYGANAGDMKNVIGKLPKAVEGLPDTVKALVETLTKLKDKIAGFEVPA